MAKFVKPQVPQGATDEERRAIYFEALSSLNLNDQTEEKNGLKYLNWATAWKTFKECYPSASYVIKKDENNLPFFSSPVGVFVNTEVSTGEGQTLEMILPVLDSSNRSQKLEDYTVSVWDSFKKTYVEKTVSKADSFSINRAITRCLTKNLAMYGEAIYLYQGAETPTDSVDDHQNVSQQNRTVSKPVAPQKPADPYAGIKAAIASTQSSADLLELYFSHQSTVEGNPEIKAMFTNRKQELSNK